MAKHAANTWRPCPTVQNCGKQFDSSVIDNDIQQMFKCYTPKNTEASKDEGRRALSGLLQKTETASSCVWLRKLAKAR